MFKFSDTSLKRLQGVDEALVEIMKEALFISPIDFGIASGYRTSSEQYDLYRQGRDFVDGNLQIVDSSKVVTYLDGYKKKSKHQLGQAVDIYAWVNGSASWKKHHLALIAGVILTIANKRGVKLTWGATFGSDSFNGFDFPHFQIER